MSRRTTVCKITDLQMHYPALKMASEALRQGSLVVFATETVYGLGANALLPAAVGEIFTAKGRPQDNPLIVHIARMEDLPALVREIPPAARQLAERFWPGPLTLVLPRSDRVSDAVSAGLDTVAVRMPSHPVARALIHMAEVPVAAPSANLSGSPSPTTAVHCITDLNGRVDLIIDSGPCSVGVESTVLTLASQTPRLLRPGAVSPTEIRETIGALEIDDAVYHAASGEEPAASPGMKYKHYAPKARLYLVHGDLPAYLRFLQERACKATDFALAFTEDQAKIQIPCIAYGSEQSPREQAERLFSALRELDAAGAQTVYARAPGMDGIGLAVYNRLVRASSFTEIYLND